MKLFKSGNQAIIADGPFTYTIDIDDWDVLINREDLFHHLKFIISSLEPTEAEVDLSAVFDPPMANQEVWAAGVTYLKSKTARMEEAKEAGGDLFYDKVYDAPRPELFFKATRQRTVGHGDKVNIRTDSSWDVPEPELTLFINSSGIIEGYTIGNDMSSRSIEGENPLYLPQAKVYERCAALGPCLYVPEEPINPNTQIQLEIFRENELLYQDSVGIDRMKRSHRELVDYLFMECSFPNGVFLMTGTCLVPPNEFTLKTGDQVKISIDNIGTLINYVAQK
jgi:2-dehydro-3-deoxy-D-arabinonate dehydratase